MTKIFNILDVKNLIANFHKYTQLFYKKIVIRNIAILLRKQETKTYDFEKTMKQSS